MIGGGRMIKMVKKGFTLVELIVVMAIFSIIMVVVMSLIDPVSKIYKNTALAEKTYANANSIQTYLQTHLEYVESIMPATSNNIGNKDGTVTSDEIRALVEEYGKQHFDYIVTAKSKAGGDPSEFGEECWVDGTIHVLRCVNSGPDRGQIMHSNYEFSSNNSSNDGFTLKSPGSVTETPEINPAFFNARDARYNYSYALGNCKFVNVPVPADGDANSSYKALDRDFNYDPSAPEDSESNPFTGNSALLTNFGLTIVIDKAGKNNLGSIDVTADNGNVYRAFRCPATVQATPISFTAILNRDDIDSGVVRAYKPEGTEPTEKQRSVTLEGNGNCGWSFWPYTQVGENSYESLISDQMDCNEDIYFIYAYTDEMRPGESV